MKIHQLRSAAAIVDCGFNLTRAAKVLNATQPGVSAHVRALETELGVAVFVRDRRRFVSLTPAGQELLPHIERVVAGFKDLQAAARHLTSAVDRPLVIASGPTPACLLPDVLKAFVEFYPKVKVGVRCAGMAAVLDDVAASRADLCLLSGSDHFPASIEFTPCYSLGWSLIARPDNELVRAGVPSLEAIARFPLITYNSDFASGSCVSTAFERQGLTPNFVLRVGDVDAMKRAARAGLGVAIARSSNLEPADDPTLVARSLDHLLPRSTIYAGVRRNEPLGAPLRFLLKLLQSDHQAARAAGSAPGEASRPTSPPLPSPTPMRAA